MDYEWTPKSAFPKVLYRVVNPNSVCKFDEKLGFTAANTTLRINASNSGISQLDLFYRSIEDHRNGKHFDSPYISVFADRMEAESWTLAAEHLFGAGCYMAEIDTNHYYLRGTAMWCVQDIQDKSLKSLAQVAANRNFPARGLCDVPRNSEWLVLHSIAGLAVMSQITPDQIRSKRRIPPVDAKSQVLPLDSDSIIGTYKTRGEYWLGVSNHNFTTTCNCLDDPCSCNVQEIPDFTEEDVLAHVSNDVPIPGYIVDTKPFVRPILYHPSEELQD